MFSSLRSRLWLSYAFLIVTALSIVAIITFIYLLRNPLLYRQTTEKLGAVSTVLVERVNSPSTEDLSVAADRASRTFNVRVLQYAQDGQLIFDTYGNKEPPILFPSKLALNRRIPIIRDLKKTAWLYSLEKLPDGSFLMVATPRPRISILSVFADEMLPPVFVGGGLALILSLVIAFLFSRSIADPMQKVILAARTVPSDSIKPVEVEGPHEVQELTRAFNSMVARTQASQKSQREFVANVSHELKTPLTSIQGFSQAILDDTADTPEARKQAAQVIYDESARMHRMVLDLLDLAKLDAGMADMTMGPVNMPALLNAVGEKFTPQSQRAGVQIIVDVPSGLPTLMGDGDRLSQVFTNLVDNALKFTPSGGRITVKASTQSGLMLVTVADTGSGIPADALAHIFDRFYQADASRKGGEKHGAGLGLAIAHEIVQAHGGKISVRSTLGEGTSFDVALPLLQKSPKK